MGNRYHVQSASMKFGTDNFDMASGPAAKSRSQEAVDVTALGDSFKRFIPGAVTEDDELTVTVYDLGTGMPAVGDKKKLEFTVSLHDGSSASAVSANFSYESAIVTKVSAPSQDGGGDRKATVEITFRPDGTQASS